MPEISEEDYNLLQNAKKFGNPEINARAKTVLDQLMDDSESGLDFQRLLKKKFPESKLPRLDIVEKERKEVDAKLAPVLEKNRELQERLDKMAKERQDEKDESVLRTEIQRVRDEYKFTDEGMNKVIDRMKAMNNPDVEAAAAWVRSKEPKPDMVKSSNILPEAMNLFGAGEKSEDESVIRLHTDPVKWQDREIATMLNEFSNQAA